MQRFKETEDSRQIYQNKIDKPCIQNNISHGGFKDFPLRLPSDKEFCDKGFNIAKNPKYDRYEHRLASMVYKYFNKSPAVGVITRAGKSTIKN